MELASPLEHFAKTLLEKNYSSFFVDLRACRGMDSTFMGILVGICTYEGFPTHVYVLHANSHNIKLMEALGLHQVLQIIEKEIVLPPSCDFKELENRPSTERLSIIQRAHEHLFELDPKNQEKFGPFLKMLHKELTQKNS